MFLHLNQPLTLNGLKSLRDWWVRTPSAATLRGAGVSRGEPPEDMVKQQAYANNMKMRNAAQVTTVVEFYPQWSSNHFGKKTKFHDVHGLRAQQI